MTSHGGSELSQSNATTGSIDILSRRLLTDSVAMVPRSGKTAGGVAATEPLLVSVANRDIVL